MLFRSEFGGVYEWQVIGSSKSTDTTFFDATPPSEVGNTGICYKVVAFENPGNVLTPNQMQSNSSYSCELKDFKIFFSGLQARIKTATNAMMNLTGIKIN